jgi:nucleotide-binding universal stress UspA family protein
VSRLRTLFGRDADWIIEHTPCDVVFVQSSELEPIEEIGIVTDRSPFNDPLKVELANSVASVAGARIRFVFAAGSEASETSIETIREYHAELDERCSVPVEGTVVRSDDAVDELLGHLESADVVMLSTETHRLLPDLLFSRETDRVATRLEQPVLLVHSRKSRRATFLEPIVGRLLFRD